MDKTAREFKAVEADLHRDVYTAAIDEHERDMGTIRVKREKDNVLMLINFTGPDAKSVSLDGKELSVYYPKIKTVQKYDISNHRNEVEQFLLLGFGATSAELQMSYDVTFIGMEQVSGMNTWHLQLVPKSKEVLQHLKKAELWIGEMNGLPMQQKFFMSGNGDYELVTYSNMKFNPSFTEGDMKLKTPKGVTIQHPQL